MTSIPGTGCSITPGEQNQCDLRFLHRPGSPAVTSVAQSIVTHRQSEVGEVEDLL